ncbi:MAG TPA: amidase [Gemmatimonadales bacterium]|jgi:amidase|nr:amidase [Gemmatimonadales bacterium]
MDRRVFLHSALTAGVAVQLAPREDGAPAVGLSSPKTPSPPFELEEATVAALQQGMTSGRWTARSITEAYLARIEAMDHQGPAINSVIEVNPDALAIADRMDQERKAGKTRGPLHGIPVLVKDNLDTGDRMMTTAGSLALAGSSAPRDSTVVARLREAGAVLLGKTNLSEWANFRSTRSTSGWSGRGGLTKNPYALNRNACGSSSGSGSAAAANFAAITIGTETDGSITCPSSIAGLVGIKPTVGLVSRTGIIPISATQDTAGPMCRTVADAAAVLAAIQGFDASDAATTPMRTRPAPDYLAELRPDGLKGARLGVARKGFGQRGHLEPLLAGAIAALKHLGAEIVDPADIPNVEKLGDPEGVVLDYEFKAGIAAYLATRRGGPAFPMKTLADLIAFNSANREKEMPWFGQEIFERCEKRGPLTTPEYLKARAECRRLSRQLGIDAIMARHRLDAIVAITEGPAWVTDLVTGDHFTGDDTTPAAVAGYPHLTVPAGMVHGLPVGLSFFGRAWSEGALIRYGYGFEQGTRHRRPPQFLPAI